MDRRIRQIAGLLTMLLVAVALGAGYVQGIASEEIANRTGGNPAEVAVNRFRIFQECRWRRGAILSVDKVELARSDPIAPGHQCLYQRVYPSGGLVPHVVGHWSLHIGKTGLEAAYNQDLVGSELPPASLLDYFERRPRVGNTIVSTIDTRLQQAALDALGGRRGGVVALSPKTGAVFVAASNPTYDPGRLASNDRAIVADALCDLGVGTRVDVRGRQVTDAQGRPVRCRNPQTPLVSIALQARRPPGSSFKVVTAAAALESGEYRPGTQIPASGSYLPKGDTRPIGNYGGGSCGGSLENALRVSCNTAFARVAVDIGADQLLTTAHAMGLDRFGGSAATTFVGCDGPPRSDIAETRTGCLPSQIVQTLSGDKQRVEKLQTAGFRARAGFGQWVLQVSPFGMAIVAGTVANGGFVPTPRFADRVIGGERGELIREIRTTLGPAALAPGSADDLKRMMRGVVSSGTGRAAFAGFPVPVAGKTGTAQQPSCPAVRDDAGRVIDGEQAVFGPRCGRLPHAWFIAFAPVNDPAIAIAVLVERGGGNNEEATGGRVAAPVARKVLERFFELYPTAAGT